MPIITATDLHKSHGSRALFAGVSFGIDEGEKVGFIGPNGAGKSTLFRILAGHEAADAGTIALQRGATVGYLAQEPQLSAGQALRTAVASGRPEMVDALAEYERLATELAGQPPGAHRLLARQGELMATIDALGGWDWQHEVETVLTQLGVFDWDRSVDQLSGGERKRVALARILLEEPDLLLLDEPTNHLDADTTGWLEERLLDYPGAVLLITHDRYFLDRVVGRMIEVAPHEFASFDGGYTEYLEAKSERAEREAIEASKRDKLMEQELAWVRRSPSARTGKQKARIKRLEAARSEAAASRSGHSELDLRFGPPPRLGRTVLEIAGLSKSYEDQPLIRDFSTRFRAGERIGVIGPNGAGKTTLLRLILGLEAPDAGEIRFGHNTRTAYFDQARGDLNPTDSVYDAVANEEWVEFGGRRIHLRSYLESFLFPTAIQDQRVGSLSGGERNRVLLARFLLQDANLLILDEPTNDLDLSTLRVLESALAEFGGCVLVVTHDRFFLDKVATGLLVFESNGVIHRHEGGYDLYRRLRAQSEAAAAAEAKPGRARKPEPESSPKSRRLSYQEKRELDGMEQAIQSAEDRRARIEVELSVPALYVDTPQKVATLATELAAAEREIEVLYARWAALEEIASSG
ncbi:MAG: ABC-F family ATP-binding cassette domain-containing protein [Gemmatimonadota bacterium]